MSIAIADCTVETVDAQGVVGVFAHPSTKGPHPGVVAFAGSAGGLGAAAIWAPALAQHGYCVLAISYFGAPGLPAELDRIDVDVVARASTWLRHRSDVSGSRFAVMGASRGSELALLAGIHVTEIGPIVALAPSGVSWSALGARGPMNSPSWLVHGEPVPYAWPDGGFTPPNADGPIRLRPLFEEMLRDRAAIVRAELPVERCRGPLLLVSGDDDQMWPSTELAERILRRLADSSGNVTCEHLHYPEAGHAFATPPGTDIPLNAIAHPLTGATYALGGTPSGNAEAQADAWPRIVAFLDLHLASD